ncbi:MAG: acyl-CoA thioesterase-2 [Bradymonadia bacterium]|jgi:acyl-CoA thioesterase-2
MSKELDELVQQLELERIEVDLFRGRSQDLGWGQVFGGQVLGQALSAAAQTVDADRLPHSLHAYFLRPGDVENPIVYHVDRIRDGGSFTTRRVVAVQHGKPIFHLSSSFHVQEPGFEHQQDAPEAPGPETLTSDLDRFRAIADRLPSGIRERATTAGPFEFRQVDPVDDPFAPAAMPPSHAYWIRARGQLIASPPLHRILLTYLSDFSFMTTALRPHGVTWLTPCMQSASLDHAMWFHRTPRVDEWLLYAIDSPAAQGARGLVRGSIYDQSGQLIASTAQEGLIRQRHAKGSTP